MKILKITLFIMIAVCASAGLGLTVYWYQHKPQYDGKLQFEALSAPVDVYFDNYGIPHIYAQNEEDAFRALGYVHAQERLFQMELLRRVGSGRLAEIFGKDLVDTDKLFRTFGLQEVAEEAVQKYFSNQSEPYQKATFAYLEGINHYIEHGSTPIEFNLLQIPKEKFTPQDCYLIMGYMAFSFSDAFRVEPILTKIRNELGENYFRGLAVEHNPNSTVIPTYYTETERNTLSHKVQTKDSLKKTSAQSSFVRSSLFAQNFVPKIQEIAQSLPVPIWKGSNSWVIAPQKTASGKVIFENDTHIEFRQPAIWYEAHLECPNWRFYGNWLAGYPFAFIGHNQNYAWGLTMFENDDVDMFQEKQDENKDFYWYKNRRLPFEIRQETISIKDENAVQFEVRSSVHGPIINDLYKDIEEATSNPVALWWTFLKTPCQILQASYQLAHGKNIDDARKAASMIYAPGVNIMYGDKDGNIAWWAAAKLIKRPIHINPNVILDGSSGKDDPLGWYDFSENPQSENPPCGFVYSANNQPDTMRTGFLYPGYYLPENRGKRIQTLLKKENQWTVKKVKKMVMDGTTANHIREAHEVVKEISKDMPTIKHLESNHKTKMSNEIKALKILEDWNGNHETDQTAPVIFYKLRYYILKYAMEDEIGEDDFENLINSHFMMRTTNRLLYHPNFIWWDDVKVKEFDESRHDIFLKAFKQTLKDLETQLGKDMSQWQWGKVHTLEHPHPLGRQKPLNYMFNVGGFPVSGGREVINNLSFLLNANGQYPVKFGSAMRIILDFEDIENSWSVLPTGQSGNVTSPHYDDQTELFNQGNFRKQMMNQEEILHTSENHLRFLP